MRSLSRADLATFILLYCYTYPSAILASFRSVISAILCVVYSRRALLPSRNPIWRKNKKLNVAFHIMCHSCHLLLGWDNLQILVNRLIKDFAGLETYFDKYLNIKLAHISAYWYIVNKPHSYKYFLLHINTSEPRLTKKNEKACCVIGSLEHFGLEIARKIHIMVPILETRAVTCL